MENHNPAVSFEYFSTFAPVSGALLVDEPGHHKQEEHDMVSTQFVDGAYRLYTIPASKDTPHTYPK